MDWFFELAFFSLGVGAPSPSAGGANGSIPCLKRPRLARLAWAASNPRRGGRALSSPALYFSGFAALRQ